MRRLIALFIFVFTLLPAQKAYADVQFPACANPQGSIIANYPSGTHGIVDNPNTVTGSDVVYKNADNQYTQCFCPTSGSGMQTNWLNAAGLSQAQIAIYVHEGWTYVADGSAWGLTADPYLAQNDPYTCNGNVSGNQGGIGGPGDGRSDGLSDGRSDGKISSPASAVLGAATSIFNLANTGNLQFILSIFGLAFIFTSLGVFFKRYNR